MTDSKTATERVCELLDEFEHECFMIRVEASETRAKDEVVRKAYERQRDETAQAIAATLGEKPRDRTEEWLLKACSQVTQDYVAQLEQERDELKQLVLDLAPFVCADDGIEGIEARMKALGFEVIDE